jgi:hypothetical protein
MQLNASRGQAIVETALILPIVIALLFAIVYFANLGTVDQRVQIAIRYGGLVGFSTSGGGLFSAANIYTAGTAPSGNNCPPPPLGILTNASPFPGPTSAPFFNPSTGGTSTANCNASAIDFKGGASFLASGFVANANESVSAQSDVPPYLNALFGSFGTVTQSEAWGHPAWPAVIIACTGPSSFQNMSTANAVEASLANESTPGDQTTGATDAGTGNYVGGEIFASTYPGTCPTPTPSPSPSPSPTPTP